MNTSYNYDNLSRLLSVLHQNGATTLDGAAYTYDNAGNRISRTNYLNNAVDSYTYDPVYQLTQVQEAVNGQPAAATEGYTYDNVGNRLSSLNVAQYTYDSSNHLNSFSDGVTYTYDNNGNTLSKSNPSGTMQYAWNFENHLSSVTLPSDGGVVSFKYDPFGRRIQKSGIDGTTGYLYDSENHVADVNSVGNIVASYPHTLGIDEPLAMQSAGTVSFFNSDGVSSITSLSNGGSQLAASYAYNAFGQSTASSGIANNPFRYTGREFDFETGIHYYRARYYDQTLGRFINEDSLQFGGGQIGFYPYVRNNPLNLVDHTGEGPEGAAIGGMIGILIGTPVGGVVGGTLGGALGGAGGTLVEPGGGTIVGGIVGEQVGQNVGANAGAALGGTAGAVIGSGIQDVLQHFSWPWEKAKPIPSNPEASKCDRDKHCEEIYNNDLAVAGR